MTLKVSREQQGEVEHTRELLTIRQMREKGFSQNLLFEFIHFYLGNGTVPPKTKILKIVFFPT